MTHREDFLQYVWKCGLYDASTLRTTDGEQVEVIDPGTMNRDAGPDFFNAKIRIGNQIWAGDVEIHRSSDEWVRHGHHDDPAYNSVILHLAEKISGEVFNRNGLQVPQCLFEIPERVNRNAEYLVYSDASLPCGDFLPELPPIFLSSFFDALEIERLERKVEDVFLLFNRFRQSWDEVCYVMLARGFGFGLNSDAFQRLALSLPFKWISRHGDRLFQIEALLFGQAGLLEEGLSTKVKPDEYFYCLQEEYRFLKRKYGLVPLESYLFKKLRTRPGSFPETRIAQLAAVLWRHGRLFSGIIEASTSEEWMSLLKVAPSDYWLTHYSFGCGSPRRSGLPGEEAQRLLLINAVVPVLFAYGKEMSDEKYCDRAIQLLETLKPESNVIIAEFLKSGVRVRNAFQSQALIQLKKNYCDRRKCLYCRIGQHLLAGKRW